MTVDGVHRDIAPGTYTGSVVLTITEGFGRAGGFGPPGSDPTDFTAVIRAENGKLCREKSVLSAVQGGDVVDGKIYGARIVSAGNKLGGLDLKDGSYSIKDVSIKMDGYGGNDFSGKGAALLSLYR